MLQFKVDNCGIDREKRQLSTILHMNQRPGRNCTTKKAPHLSCFHCSAIQLPAAISIWESSGFLVLRSENIQLPEDESSGSCILPGLHSKYFRAQLGNAVVCPTSHGQKLSSPLPNISMNKRLGRIGTKTRDCLRELHSLTVSKSVRFLYSEGAAGTLNCPWDGLKKQNCRGIFLLRFYPPRPFQASTFGPIW